jgi:hypothetical protein
MARSVANVDSRIDDRRLDRLGCRRLRDGRLLEVFVQRLYGLRHVRYWTLGGRRCHRDLIGDLRRPGGRGRRMVRLRRSFLRRRDGPFRNRRRFGGSRFQDRRRLCWRFWLRLGRFYHNLGHNLVGDGGGRRWSGQDIDVGRGIAVFGRWVFQRGHDLPGTMKHP